jgi:hypothetical protein
LGPLITTAFILSLMVDNLLSDHACPISPGVARPPLRRAAG